MELLYTYYVTNFMTIMILFALIALMIVNRDVKIPATNLFRVSIVLLVGLTSCCAASLMKDMPQKRVFLH